MAVAAPAFPYRLMPPRCAPHERMFVVEIEFEGDYEIEQTGTGFPSLPGARHFNIEHRLGWGSRISACIALGIRGVDEADAVRKCIVKLEGEPMFYRGFLQHANAYEIRVRYDTYGRY